MRCCGDDIEGRQSAVKRKRILRNLIWILLAVPGLGLCADRAHSLAEAMSVAASRKPLTVTILPAASGAQLQSYAGGSASLSFGQAAYYAAPKTPGITKRKDKGAMTLITRFGLRVDCGLGSSSSFAEVTMSLLDKDPFDTVRVDGARLTNAGTVAVQRCGSVTEHRVEVEITTLKPPGPIGTTVSFSATVQH
jgi:hypothetical protein